LLIRVNQLAAGGSGLDPAVADAIIGLLNDGELPDLHRGGAIGTGDLGDHRGGLRHPLPSVVTQPDHRTALSERHGLQRREPGTRELHRFHALSVEPARPRQ
ncbi:MAG TPA: aromatic amino acid lyase, partial [Kribbella sp.]